MTLEQYDAALWLNWAIMAAVLGLVCGSFFNVCIYRMPAGRSIVRPGSHCYSCGTYLKWYDNIPLLSYLILRGNCRYCGTHFSPRYFGVELLTGALFLFAFVKFGPGWIVPFQCVFIGFLIVGTFTDIDHYILPDSITLGGLLFALITAAVLGRRAAVYQDYLLARDIYYSFTSADAVGVPHGIWALIWALISGAFGWTLLTAVGMLGRLLFRKEAMGGGDIKLFAFLGAYLGAVNCLAILFLSALLGMCLGIALILVHKFFRKDEFEEIELLPSQKIAAPAAIDTPQLAAQRDTLVVGETVQAGVDAVPDPGIPISIRLARNTARQLHHFPFGPYIAVAAVLLMFFQPEADLILRQRLFLMPSPLLMLYTPGEIPQPFDDGE